MYKAVNTLDAPSTKPTNTRASYLAQTKARNVHGDRGEAANSNAAIRENNHAHPVKKQRTGPSPKESNRESPIEVDDSQEFNGFTDDEIQGVSPTRTSVSPTRRRQPWPYIDIPSLGQKNANNGLGKPTPQPVVVIDNIRLPKDASKEQNPSRSSSDDDLFPKHLMGQDSDNDGVQFMKDAIRERRADRESSPQKPPSSNPNRLKFQDTDPVSRERARVLDSESPDVLHATVPRQSGSASDRPKNLDKQPASQIADLINGNSGTRKLSRPRRTAAHSSSLDHANTAAFPVKKVAGFYIPDPEQEDYYNFYVDLDAATFWFDKPDGHLDTDHITTPRPTSKVHQIFQGDKSTMTMLKLSRSADLKNTDFVMDLGSQKKVNDLINVFQQLDRGVKIIVRPDHFFPKAYQTQLDMKKQYEGSRQNRDAASPHAPTRPSIESPYFAPVEAKCRRDRMIDNLDRPEDKPAEHTVIGPEDRQEAAREILGELPVANDSTRSQTLRSAKQSERPRYRSPTPKLKYSQTVGLGEQWKNDLVYPKDGKKRETVEWGDLYRLDEDEFLNDVLIGFFARYVQHQVEEQNPHLLKKMHFFNTYFFDTLTKNSKAKKDINHAAVARWTKAIDIFSRDFVVVPVNDNLHWYLAIICNLSYFTKKKSQDHEEEGEDVEDSVQILDNQTSPPKEDDMQEAQQGERTQQTQRSFQDLSLDDKTNLVPSSHMESRHSSQTEPGLTPAKSKAGRKKKLKVRRSLPKYDTEIPVIITLDSLAQPRGAAIAALKQYIVLEAKDKKGIEIDKEDIRGMTAKGIPSQGNYSDCGLYMCMYLEQFMIDPYGFARKILQREEGELRWPKTIRSEKLRTQLRDMIMELYRRQEGGQPKKDIPPLGKIVVEMREPSPEVIPSTPPSRSPRSRTNSSNLDNQPQRDYEEARKRLQKIENEAQVKDQPLNSQGHIVTHEEARPSSSSSQKRTLEEALYQVDHDPYVPSNMHNPIILGDDSPEKSTKRLKRAPGMATTSNPPFKKHQSKHIRFEDVEDVESPVKGMQHSGPQELADKLRQARGSPAQRTRAKTATPAKREVRSTSASTDFLSGITSYAAGEHEHEEKTGANLAKDDSESELGSEVPETQELDIEERDARESQQLQTQGRKGNSQDEMLV